MISLSAALCMNMSTECECSTPLITGIIIGIFGVVIGVSGVIIATVTVIKHRYNNYRNRLKKLIGH